MAGTEQQTVARENILIGLKFILNQEKSDCVGKTQ
jgi:hypothetical protein